MALLFSHITISADNGSTETFLCGGIPKSEDDFENLIAYQNFLESNTDVESIEVDVKSYVYGEGKVLVADQYEVAYFTSRGPEFINKSNVEPYDESNFTIFTENEETMEMGM